MRPLRRTPIAVFHFSLMALFVAFAAVGVARLPILDGESETLTFAERFDSAETRLRQAIMALEGALAASQPERVAQLSRKSRHLADESLALRPLNPQAWLVRAQANYLLGDDAAALADWQRSLDRGPYERIIALERADLGLRLWYHLAEEQKVRLLRHIRWMWSTAPGEVVTLARRSANHELLVRRALAGDPAALEKLEGRLASGS